MDTFFPRRRNNDYGTWKCNRNVNKGYIAALDHILVNMAGIELVKHCGVVTHDQFSMP